MKKFLLGIFVIVAITSLAYAGSFDGGTFSDERNSLDQVDHNVLLPVNGDNHFFWKPRSAVTVSNIECIVDPADSGESVVLTVKECDGNGDSCAGLDGATTITCANTTTSDDGTLSDPSIAADAWVSGTIGTITGSVSQLALRLKY